MNGPTKTVGPPLTSLPARKSRGVLEKVLDNADDARVRDPNRTFQGNCRWVGEWAETVLGKKHERD